MGKYFGTSGIRGLASSQLTDAFVRKAADAAGAFYGAEKKVCIARDTRPSGQRIRDALAQGLAEQGCEVTDFGVLTTPGLYYLTRELGFDGGVMITASHNPPEYNGIKFCDANGALPEADEEAIEKLIDKPPARAKTKGTLREIDGVTEYAERLVKIAPKPRKRMRVLVDCAAGPAALVAPRVLRKLGYDVVEFNCVPDATKSNRPLEPKAPNLKLAVEALRETGAEAGIAFDGDADRVAFFDRNGAWDDDENNAAVCLANLKSKKNRLVIGTVESRSYLDAVLAKIGATVYRTKVGDGAIVRACREKNAAMGVEESGHYVMPEFGFFSAALYPALVLLASTDDFSSVRKTLAETPRNHSSKKRLACPNEKKQKAMAFIGKKLESLEGNGVLNDADGFRYDYPDSSWLMVRPSGTEPIIKLYFEARTLVRVQELERAVESIAKEALG
ncbi:hypothetical protein AUJ16_03795 [Candidatus Micrarchaeota archaeon CG1_02_60_51]|nr:MAG: hypothetical protein AUJ16_03795 [Candidatus Micrarchaeota archaeon CG1_02_60_51]